MKRDNSAEQIIAGMETLTGIFRALLWEQAKEHGLSAMQVQLLLHISRSQQTTITALAKVFMLAKATISVAVKSLESKGHIAQHYTGSDRRSYSISLTDSGARIAHVSGFYLEPVKKIVAKIKPEEREILLRNIAGIIQKIQVT